MSDYDGYDDGIDDKEVLDTDLDDDSHGSSGGRNSQHLPELKEVSRPTKRRRSSYTSTEDDSINGFIDDEDDEIESVTSNKKHAKTTKSKLSKQDIIDDDVEGKEHKKKKSKYKINIPKDNIIPAPIVQYGTQLPENPNSSPYRIRGAKWKFPRQVAQDPAFSRTPEVEKEAVFSVCDMDDINDLNKNPEILGFSAWKTLQAEQPTDSILNEEHTTCRQLLGPSPAEIAQELADLPSDAFSSSPETGPLLPSRSMTAPSQPQQRLVGPQTGLRQTTLFGGRAREEEQTPSQLNKVHNYRVDMIPEAPTHHKLNQEALKTWIYPTNLGPTRDYQFNIVRQGLFNNMLVALPTGLGKTFIAATIMLNYFRWTQDAKIVFMAPTKPLVAQQVSACFNIAGIPRSTTTMLTGDTTPAVRAEEWEKKRMFFMTPQTLDNDLRTGIADPKKIVLLVIDEAHRATGNYAYVRVVSFMRRFSKSFRVLALTATPGSSVEAVQDVIDNLEISKVEIRTEESMDIQQFTHRRKIEQILLDPSDEIVMLKDLLAKALQPLVDQLCGQNAYWNKDPMSLTAYGLMQAQKSWFASETGRRASFALKGMMHRLFSILGSIAHAIKLLNFHGIGPFFGVLKDFRAEFEENGNKGGKYRKQINDSPHFKKMMDQIQAWIRRDDFVGHPKLTYLCDTVLNHFLDAGDGRLPDGAEPSKTRVIVFAEFRDSAEEISRVLNRHRPMVRATVFVGQADSKRSAGMNQKEQIAAIEKFKKGAFNVLVATSIGEEGLDIGQVDLIVCYDASGSPIRMLQRMGRTGRKRAGNVVLLLMRGKEEESFSKAKDNYEQMQKLISSGTRFSYRHDLSTRIVPREISPVVEKKHVEIPPENSQDQSLPEPKRRATKAKKKPPKKFNMPDGVETGFKKASKFVKDDDCSEDSDSPPLETSEEELKPVPELETVVLSPGDLQDLERSYQNVSGDSMQEVTLPDMTSQPQFQRSLGPTKLVQHGQATRRVVDMIRAMRNIDEATLERWQEIYNNQGPVSLDEELAALSPISSPTPSSIILESDLDLHTQRPKSQSSKTNKAHRGKAMLSTSEEGSDTSHSSDDDEDLEDFVVRDTEPLGRRHTASTRSSSPPDLAPPKSKPFFEPTDFAPTQETNDDEAMPDLDDLLRTKSTGLAPSISKQSDSVNKSGAMENHRGKRRRIVEEDSDE